MTLVDNFTKEELN